MGSNKPENIMFEVIQGGGGQKLEGSKVQWQKRWRQVRAIEATLIHSERTAVGPRAGFAIVAGIVTAGTVMAADFGLQQFGWSSSALPWQFARRAVALAPLVLGLVAYMLVLRRSARPKTWTGRIDQLLAAYAPIDKKAYRRLQQQTRDLGYLETDLVFQWLQHERHAIEAAAGWLDPEPGGFLNKKV
jgi:hypothetical protein